MALLSSFGSIVPEPSVSKRLKASRISSTSSSVRPGRSTTFAEAAAGFEAERDAMLRRASSAGASERASAGGAGGGGEAATRCCARGEEPSRDESSPAGG